MKRSPMKRSVPRRSWEDAVRHHEGKGCRVCLKQPRELAHTIGRKYDEGGYVHPLSVVPLCREHHGQYDAHALDLRPYLREEEVQWAITRLGRGEAMRRFAGRTWLQETDHRPTYGGTT